MIDQWGGIDLNLFGNSNFWISKRVLVQTRTLLNNCTQDGSAIAIGTNPHVFRHPHLKNARLPSR